MSTLNETLATHRRRHINISIAVNRVDVDRDSLWEDSIITFKNPKFNPGAKLRVRFVGEAGLDAGGLRLEYCTLLAKAICSKEAALFEGCADRCVPIYNANAIQSNIFGIAGKMISYIITHHDISIPCLSPAVYTYIATGDIEKAVGCVSLSDVPDLEIREVISQVCTLASESLLIFVNCFN